LLQSGGGVGRNSKNGSTFSIVVIVLFHGGPGEVSRSLTDEDKRGSFMTLLRDIWDRAKGHLGSEVSSDDALCEFDCRKPQCVEWEYCSRRLQQAAGELMPTKASPWDAAGK